MHWTRDTCANPRRALKGNPTSRANMPKPEKRGRARGGPNMNFHMEHTPVRSTLRKLHAGANALQASPLTLKTLCCKHTRTTWNTPDTWGAQERNAWNPGAHGIGASDTPLEFPTTTRKLTTQAALRTSQKTPATQPSDAETHHPDRVQSCEFHNIPPLAP